jgi:ABC-type glycerol-3-phosphate transport system substrate-binding protein
LRTLALLLSLLVLGALGLAACGGGGDDDDDAAATEATASL